MCVSALLGLGTAAIGAFSSNRAANAQERAANDQLQLGREQLAASEARYQDQRAIAEEVARRQRLGADNTLRFQTRATNEAARRLRSNADQYGRQATTALREGFGRNQGIADAYQRQATDAMNGYQTNALAAAGSTRDAQVAEFRPYADSGRAANAAYAYELGIGNRPRDYRGYEASPGYEFQRSEGLRAIDGSAASRGGLLSGRTMRDAMTFGTGLAQQDYGNHLARLSGQSAQGMQAAGAIAGAEGQYGQTQQNIYGTAADMGLGIAGNVANMNTASSNALNSGLQGVYGNQASMNNAAIGQQAANLFNAYGNWGSSRAAGWGTLGNLGQSAGAQMAGASGNAYNFMGNALANYGDAASAGAIGVGNAITGGIQNGLGYYQMNRLLQSPLFQGTTVAGQANAAAGQGLW